MPTNLAEDQFEPALAFDNTANRGVIDWYDTAESTTTYPNEPTSIHGQVSSLSGTIPGNLKVFFPSPSYRLGPNPVYDLGDYNGAAPFGDGVHFAVGFTDGWDPMTAPNGQGGIYTATAAP